jgi:uncharacterized heparinase superfamily protein
VQIYGRVWFRLAHPNPILKSAPELCKPLGVWVGCAERRQSIVAPDEFYFLNQAGALKDLGWDDPGTEKLWRYNQHYFDDLNAVDASSRTDWHVALLNNWLVHNPPGQGTGWEPYPTSLRIVNWIKWTLAGKALLPSCIQSLAVQTRWLTKRLEIHLLGNHLFANAKALVFAGLAFQGKEAAGWLQQGIGIILRELTEQVLPDGGNFERSPMYHSIFLEDMLDLINAARAWPGKIAPQVVENWQLVATTMVIWLNGMTHPDGQIALFNDAAFGVTPTPADLNAYAQRLGLTVPVHASSFNKPLGVQQWPQSGYIRLTAPHTVVLLDVAPIGPDYLPSHANADTLSFELSLFGQRVIVNGGTSRYGSGPERLSERQTAAHSTLEINGQSSSEVWGGFRVARRAYPFNLKTYQCPDHLSVECSHDGYKRLTGEPVHRRSWYLQDGSLIVTDLISGNYDTAISRFIFHPDIVIKNLSPSEYRVILLSGRTIDLNVLVGNGQIVQANYASEFGKPRQTQCLQVFPENGKAVIRTNWVCS